MQRKYGRGIYSHDTALYLLGYWDRTPAQYTMTFPKGYNAPSLKQENLIIKRVVPENYEFGQIQIKSPSGNPIRVYDLERTLCDILRGSGSDIQIVSEAMKRYADSKDKNIHKLMKYADQLRVKPKVLRYMEVLLSGKAIPFESCGKNTDANMTTQRIFPLKIPAILFRKL